MRILSAIALSVLLGACADHGITLEVRNPADVDRTATIELDARQILDSLRADYCYVSDYSGREIASQITFDSLLVFVADVEAGGSAKYTVKASDTARIYPPTVCGRAYPERADDIAWENETGGYRVYGPATQARGERAFGYDLFFKYEGEPVVESLYQAQTSAENWHKVDSLRAIDPQLAKDFEHSFTYHVDHGKGMDCYAVGATLGAGVPVPYSESGLNFAWCYEKARILNNGPVRFTVELTFAPRAIGADTAIVETRTITLDSHALLNRSSVRYIGATDSITVAVGFPRRDDTPAYTSADGVIAYSDPTQGPDNGRPYLGIVAPKGFDSTLEAHGHILGLKTIAPEQTYEYSWGFVWNRNESEISLDSWTSRLESPTPLIVVF